MKINWKARFHNKAFVITFATVVIAFVYQILALFDVVPKITEDNVIQLITLIINLLAGLGIVVDGTTEGINDSDRAMTYYQEEGVNEDGK